MRDKTSLVSRQAHTPRAVQRRSTEHNRHLDQGTTTADAPRCYGMYGFTDLVPYVRVLRHIAQYRRTGPYQGVSCGPYTPAVATPTVTKPGQRPTHLLQFRHAPAARICHHGGCRQHACVCSSRE